MLNNFSAQISQSDTADEELMHQLCTNKNNVDHDDSEESDRETNIECKEILLEEAVSGSTTTLAITNSKAKHQNCCICGAEAIYRCPGCGRRTCSLTCVRVHKVDHACTGTREIANHVPLHEYNDAQLQRDFTFLEDCRRVIDNATRLLPRTSCRFTFKHLPAPLAALRQAAKRRGVICQLVSAGMHKREVNTSRYDKATDTIIWHCDFHFVCGNASNSFIVTTDWGSERFKLCDVLRWCWATNPPLPSFHINRRYNKSTEYTKQDASTRLKAVHSKDINTNNTENVNSHSIKETTQTDIALVAATTTTTTTTTTISINKKDKVYISNINMSETPFSRLSHQTQEQEEKLITNEDVVNSLRKDAQITSNEPNIESSCFEEEPLTLEESTQGKEEREEEVEVESDSENESSCDDDDDGNHDDDNCVNSADSGDDKDTCAKQHKAVFFQSKECDEVHNEQSEMLELHSLETNIGNYHGNTNENNNIKVNKTNVHDQNQCKVPAITIWPMTDEEKVNEARVHEFIGNSHFRSPEESADGRTCEDDLVILCQAEHLNGSTRYFHMKPNDTLNENMRLLFFVNEYPVFTVIHACDLHSYTLMTLEDKFALRESLRPKPRVHEDKSKQTIPEVTELSEEERAKLARTPCKHFLHGKCSKESNCPYWHCTREEVPVCRQYARNKRCPLGNRCLFRHDANSGINSSNNKRSNNNYNYNNTKRKYKSQHRGTLPPNAVMKRSRAHE